MYRMAAELRDLEEQAADAERKRQDGYAPGAYFWESWAAMPRGKADELRPRIPEHLQ